MNNIKEKVQDIKDTSKHIKDKTADRRKEVKNIFNSFDVKETRILFLSIILGIIARFFIKIPFLFFGSSILIFMFSVIFLNLTKFKLYIKELTIFFTGLILSYSFFNIFFMIYEIFR